MVRQQQRNRRVENISQSRHEVQVPKEVLRIGAESELLMVSRSWPAVQAAATLATWACNGAAASGGKEDNLWFRSGFRYFRSSH